MEESEAELAEYVLKDRDKPEKPETAEEAKQKAGLQTIVFAIALLVFVIIFVFIFLNYFEIVWPF